MGFFVCTAAALINVVPAGETGVFLEEKEADIAQGSMHTLFLVGLPGDLDSVVLPDDRRRLAACSKFRLVQGAARFETMDAYLVTAGTDIGLVSPTTASLLYRGSAGYRNVAPGAYDLVLTLPDSKTAIGGPHRLDPEGGGIYGAVAVDRANITTADIILLDEFAPAADSLR